jgi:C4-dicarboxylate-specific signal transduction histidine kinase
MGSETAARTGGAGRIAETTALRARVVAAALGLAVSFGAIGVLPGSPRAQVAAALVAIAAAGWGGLALRRLGSTRESDPAPPHEEFAFDVRAARERLALMDGQIEHMPVALWSQAEGGAMAPLNARARRLLAPGGVVDREGLSAQLAAAGSGTLLRVVTERGEERWLASATRVSLAGEERRLLALMPVESELEAAAMTAWRQLVHVLTHEIMNSLTPIASLSRSAGEMRDDPAAADDLALALDTIARRAESLSRFVGNYRQVSELPAPRLEPVQLAEVFARLERMVGAAWRERGGEARFVVEPESLGLVADAGQLEQALLNLVKNAAEATAAVAQPRLDVQARLARGGRLLIEVRDNGPGVPSDLENDIFMPFVSTRGDARHGGRGIGLAVVRSLVHGMGGTVRHVRTPQGGACFALSF